MDWVDRMSGRAFQVSPATLLKFTNLDPRVQTHLARVYSTLAAAVAVAVVGVWCSLAYSVGGFLTTLGAFASMVSLAAVDPKPDNLNKRYVLLAAFSFCQGCSIGPLVQLALNVHPGLIALAFAGTCAVFACFSLAALITKRRAYLFLGGTLASGISGLMVMRLVGWLFGSSMWMFQAELYLGLVLFSLYVVFDTQLIVEKAHAGDFDHVKHALDLFVDFVAMFVRVLLILLQNQEKRERRKKERKD